MKNLILTAVCLCLAAGMATAQIDTTADGIGIYADLEAMQSQVQLDAYQPLEVYLLLTNPTSDLGYGAFQCGIEVPDNAQVWGFSFPHAGTIALMEGTNIIAAWPQFLPMESANLLMTFIIMPLDSQSAYFNVGDCHYNGHIIEASYLLPGDVILPLHPHVNAVGASFSVNDNGQVATDEVTLDQVKALYR